MSARPGLCGGHRVTGVPTAIDNNHAHCHRLLSRVNLFLKNCKFVPQLGNQQTCPSFFSVVVSIFREHNVGGRLISHLEEQSPALLAVPAHVITTTGQHKH
jgi:hypothetical protein